VRYVVVFRSHAGGAYSVASTCTTIRVRHKRIQGTVQHPRTKPRAGQSWTSEAPMDVSVPVTCERASSGARAQNCLGPT
jgi:hypothetical protein